MREIAQALLQLYDSGQRGALATVVRVSGSTPQEPGARLLLHADGSTVGTVGGGALEHAVLEALREVLSTGTSRLLVQQLGHDLGMCCGGRMEVFVEAIESAPQLVLCGAGHVARAVAALARSVGFDVSVIDERDTLLTEARFPDCRLHLLDPVSYLRRTPLGPAHHLVIATHDHALDGELLTLAMGQSARYVGLLGSKRKVLRLLQRAHAIVGQFARETLYGPVGIDIGAVSPEEIAVSIVSELIAVRRGKPVPHMRLHADDGERHSTPEPRVVAAAPKTAPAARELPAATPARSPVPAAEPPEASIATAQDQLAARVHDQLDHLRYPARDWLWARKSAREQSIYDVVVVGAGQGGLAAAFALMRERVTNLLVVDQNPLDRAGPWLNFARMPTLRTPKHLTGPDLGVPALTPRAFYEARHGAAAWDALRFIPRTTWAEYLAWYRRTLDIPVQPDTRVGALHWNAGERAFELPCTRGGTTQPLLARRVVLATGIEGSGQWHVPESIAHALPRELYAHTCEAIDFEALADRRVAVLGAGASAFDNAATALEGGAREVRLFCRRPQLVDVNPYRWAEFAGFLAHAGELPDADKWRFVEQIVRMGQLPPADSLRRVMEHPRFELQPGADWRTLSVATAADGRRVITIESEAGRFETDFVIVGTGFVTDLSLRPELQRVQAHIARWSDRYTPPAAEHNADLARHPYLGPHFEFTEREPGAAPYLNYLYNYTFGGLLSLGFGGASLSGMKYSIPRLVGGITASLFVEDRDKHLHGLRTFGEREFEPALPRSER